MNQGSAINTAADSPRPRTAFELRFQFLFNEGRALAFPCDAEGHVELAALSERARSNFLRACALVGREFAVPALQRRDTNVSFC